MAKKAVINNDWQTIIAKPEPAKGGKKFKDEEPDPFHQKREDTYYTLFPSQEGEKYAFAIVPGADGKAFVMEDVMIVKRHRFTSPKDGKHYFETLKLPMNPSVLFDMTVVDKALKNAELLTEEDKKTLADIKTHSALIQRLKDLQYCKVDNVNFGYSQVPNLFSSRIQKQALTAYFGAWTKWKGVLNTKREFGIKFISTRYGAYQDKFRALLNSTSETHNELQPTWYQDYFSHLGEVKGVIDVEMGAMGVGGKGATVKLVKLGKDVIDDKGVGVTGPISEKDIVLPKGPENELSHMHYFMGFKSNEDLWQDAYIERVEVAIEQLEQHVDDVKLKNLADESKETPTAETSKPTTKVDGPTDKPEGDKPF